MELQKPRRGRPSKNGKKPLWMIVRMMTVLDAYEQARSKGEKHSSAVTEAVTAVKTSHAGVKLSETEVKRILAEYRPKDAPIVARVTKKPSSLVLGYGPRPEFTRSNAAKPKRKA